jgi:DHA2 family multidrug resistance protein
VALTEYLSWRMVFFLSVVSGLVCIVLVWLILPNVCEEVQHSFDLPGLLTMSVFLVSLLVALSREQREGWGTPFIQQPFVVPGVVLVTFIACELLVDEPLVDL